MDAIVEAAARVLTERGYDATTTNHIAATAGVSVGTLYEYFPSKEAIVAALIEREGQAEVSVVLEAGAQAIELPLRAGIETIVRAMVERHRENPALHRILVESVPETERGSFVRTLEARVETALVWFLNHRAAELRVDDREAAAYIVMRTVESVVHGAVRDRPTLLEGTRLVDELSSLLIRYLAIDGP